MRRTLCLLLLAPGLVTAQASDTDSQALERLAGQLRASPNRVDTHLEVARAYFRRGAQDDAQRVRRHLRRATELDPERDTDASEVVNLEQPGERSQPRSAREREVDDRIRAAIPVIREGEQQGNTWDEVIQMGLAERMVERCLPEAMTSFTEAQGEYAALFEVEDERDQLEEKLAAASQGVDTDSWEAAWTRRVARTMQRTAGNPDAELPTMQVDDEEVPDPLTSKNRAVAAFFEGDTTKAIDGLVETIAAAEVLRNDNLRGASGALVEGVASATEASPSQDQEGPPDIGGTDPGGAPGGGGTGQAPPPPPPGDGAGGPGGAPPAPTNTAPALAQSIGEQAMQTLEAASNAEVPASEVRGEMAELAAQGMVGDPLLLDLDRDGAPGVPGGSRWPDGELGAGRVLFDLDADGAPEWTEWPTPGGDALLAVDLDGDGAITDGDELFGRTGGARHGFERLAVFDVDGDGWVAGAEAADLVAWRDDGDGVSEPGELVPLAELGILAIGVAHDVGVGRALTTAGELVVWDWLPDTRPAAWRAAR